MKRILLLLASAAVVLPSYGWGRLGHAAINKIAEDHLTGTTRKAIDKYMGGESIVTFASYPDDYRNRLNETFRPGWNKAKVYAHTFEVDSLLMPFHGIDDNGRYVTNALYFIDGFISDLRNAESLDEESRFIEIVMLCHFIGDMHCPGHIRYQPKRDIASWKVTFLDMETKYHTVWDGDILRAYYPWSWSDFASMCDISDKDEIEETIKGDIYSWGHDAAVSSYDVRMSVKKGDSLDAEWAIDQLELTRTMIRRAGYRLAHQLNMIFDAKYAKRHSGK
ncbi:MAG: S1/P1 nuclease [Clostridium sp.]|nr:S1/P1 nuclease [Bacteroides sp.]MCM1197658.1 S1/P1 nuclease [Clostridium sp.]